MSAVLTRSAKNMGKNQDNKQVDRITTPNTTNEDKLANLGKNRINKSRFFGVPECQNENCIRIILNIIRQDMNLTSVSEKILKPGTG
nr:unnamed protein product [Callosobruchus analis]